jgi:NDP-sugar pyrophosphorylase family protein
MILAAGLGTRLRPLTFEKAKPAIPLWGKAIIVRLIDKLGRLGISEFRVNLHHFPSSIQRLPWHNELPWASISFAPESVILGTAGGLKANERFFQDGTFIMANGDIVIDLELEEAIRFHKTQKALATLILLPQNKPFRFYPVRIDDDGRLVHFKEKHAIQPDKSPAYVFSGIHILEPEIFRYIPAGVFWEMNDSVYPEAILRKEKILGFPVNGYWNDIGTTARYLAAHKNLCNANSSKDRRGLDLSNVRIESDAIMGPCVWAGEGCILRSGSCVENSILWENVTLMPGAELHDCIVGSNAIVEGAHQRQVITQQGIKPIDETT